MNPQYVSRDEISAKVIVRDCTVTNMDETEIESAVAAFRAQYPDLTDDEERGYRDHLVGGETFVFRCRIDNPPTSKAWTFQTA